jgi:hypothetical protein
MEGTEPVVSSTFQSKISSKAPNKIDGTFCWKLHSIVNKIKSSGRCCLQNRYKSFLSRSIMVEKLTIPVLQDKCVSYHAFAQDRKYKTWEGARLECQRQGGDLATAKTPERLHRLHDIMKVNPQGRCAYVGLVTVALTPSSASMYRCV